MNYLTAAQVLFIHARLIAETGGATGLRDLGLLEDAVTRPQATFDGADLYPDRWAQAAALMASLVQSHPFVDGNKRVGVTAAGIFLQRNGLRLTATGMFAVNPSTYLSYHMGDTWPKSWRTIWFMFVNASRLLPDFPGRGQAPAAHPVIGADPFQESRGVPSLK